MAETLLWPRPATASWCIVFRVGGTIQGVGEQSVGCSQATRDGCGQVGWQVLGGPQGACLMGSGS